MAAAMSLFAVVELLCGCLLLGRGALDTWFAVAEAGDLGIEAGT